MPFSKVHDHGLEKIPNSKDAILIRSRLDVYLTSDMKQNGNEERAGRKRNGIFYF